MEQRGFQEKIDEESSGGGGGKRLRKHLTFKVFDVSHVETILNIFTRRSLRSQTQGDDGNNFFSFFLPDELKRSDWRFLFTSVHFFLLFIFCTIYFDYIEQLNDNLSE